MEAGVLAALEGSGLAAALRGSTWLYPLVNTAHVLGVALLVGAIAALDLRMLGLWAELPLAVLSRVLVPVAATGLALAVVAGSLLFAAGASEYAASPLFRAKMALVALGIANALGYRLLRRRHPESPTLLRAAGTISLATWLAVLTLGRLIGYF